ncbi:MAG: Gx transporter family protein [Clostridia bacterium]
MRRGWRTSDQAAWGGVMVALAFLLGAVERMLPPISSTVPGVKLGLANLPVLITLYACGSGLALCVTCARAVLSGLLFGGPMMAMYGMVGALVSFAAMACARGLSMRTSGGGLGVPGVSLLGGVCHNMGQWLVAACLLRAPGLWSLLPLLIVSGAVSGFVMGLLASCILRRPNVRTLSNRLRRPS